MIRSDLALAALASAAVPGMRPVSVATVRTGEENPLHQSALVEDVTGRRWVVRSPLGAAAGAELERNDDLVKQLGKHLPFKVPSAAGYADLGQDGRAAVYPYVEGQALSLRHLPAGPGLASAVGRAIAAVHNMPRELFEEHAVPVFDAAEFRSRRLAELDRAAETGHVPNGLLARWEQALEAAAMWQFATVPTHGSLDGSSFLVVFSDDDAASGRVVGLTGWERAQVADPAEDFAHLVEVSNPRAVDAVFESYAMARSQRPDGYLLHRARLTSEMRLLKGLVAAIGRDDAAFVRVRADELRKLDRLTANDDSLVPRTALVPAEAPVAHPSELSDAADTGADTREATDAESPQPSTEAPGADVADVADVDVDATGPVPPIPGSEGDEDEPAFVVEQPSDGSHLEPAHRVDNRGDNREATVDGPASEPSGPATGAPVVSPADVTAPIPMFRPVDLAATPEGDLPSKDADQPSAQADVSHAGTGPAATYSALTADETRSADERSPDRDAEADRANTGNSESVTDIEAVEHGVRDGTAPADSQDEETTPNVSSADPVTTSAVAGTDPEDSGASEGSESAREDSGASEGSSAEEADERLHTLYGMPDADDIESWESGTR